MSILAGVLASTCSGCPFGGRGGGFSWWIPIVIALGVIIIAMVAYDLIRRHRGVSFKKESEDPLAIAQRRYASGEMTSDEFENIKKNLPGGPDEAP